MMAEAKEGPTRWTVEIPDWHPSTLNNLLKRHWATRARIKKQDEEFILFYSLAAGVPKAKGKRRVGQVLTLARRDRRRDNDGAWKTVLDGLVKARMLVDDSPDWVETTEPTYERGRFRKTLIVIEEVE